jgi:hypothetical protein
MKKVLLLLLVSSMIAGAAFAQDHKDAKDHKAARAEWEKKVKAELNLNQDQTAKFDALSKEYNDKMDALMTDASLTKDAQKEKKMALKKEKEGKLFEFITPEQQTKYKELMDKKKESKP